MQDGKEGDSSLVTASMEALPEASAAKALPAGDQALPTGKRVLTVHLQQIPLLNGLHPQVLS